MNISQVLGNARAVAASSVAVLPATLQAGPVEATGQAPAGASSPPSKPPLGSPALGVAVLAFAALGGLVALRFAFKGAVS